MRSWLWWRPRLWPWRLSAPPFALPAGGLVPEFGLEAAACADCVAKLPGSMQRQAEARRAALFHGDRGAGRKPLQERPAACLVRVAAKQAPRSAAQRRRRSRCEDNSAEDG